MTITFVGDSDKLHQLIELAKKLPGVKFNERPGNIFSLSADPDGGDKPSLARVNELREARSLPPLAAL